MSTKQIPLKNIRNFSIIAHIDHGKSTLADRLIELTGTIEKRDMQAQMMDTMEIERERGITVKANAIRLNYTAKDGEDYQLNLIDTPGHVDFSYEVSRSLAACEGALLVVDAAQGVEAQTLANVYTAIDLDLEVVPVLNKIDLPAAEPERVKEEIEDIIGLDTSDAVACSAKSGLNVEGVLEEIVQKIPAPTGDEANPLKALLVDAWYDNYLGVVVLARLIDGTLAKGQKIKFMQTGRTYTVERVGAMHPQALNRVQTLDALYAGEVGVFTAAIKEVADAKVGDTITDALKPVETPLQGFKDVQPLVFCGLYPTENDDYSKLTEALAKLRINDTSFTYISESSPALGHGYRCGFLGLLHMEIIQERLEREFDLDLVTTAPNVVYRITTTNGEEIDIENPAQLPDITRIKAMHEPMIKATIMVPEEYVGAVINLCVEKRGQQLGMDVHGHGAGTRMMLTYRLPLNEVVLDFNDRIKSLTRGYASFDYVPDGYDEGKLAKVDILINGDPVDAFSMIVHKEFSEQRGRKLLIKLKELIPRQQFEVALQLYISDGCFDIILRFK